MSVMKVKCTDQVLKIVEAPTIASGGVNEVRVEFEFCEKWDGFEKTALFYQNEDEIYYAILDENNACYVPWEVCYSNGTFYFSVFGNKGETRRTSTTIKYKVTKGVISEIMMPSVPTPGVYEQLLAKLEEVKGTIPADDEVNFLVHLDSVNYEPTSDKTYAQILEASNAGKQVLGVCGDVKYVCGGPYDISEHFVFYPVYHSGMFYLQHEVTVKKDNTWSSSEVGLPDDIHINSLIDAKVPTDEHITGLIEDNNEVFFADYDTNTLAEILEANNAGKHCVARYANREFHLVTALNNKGHRQEAVFMGLSEDGNSIVVIRVPESWDTGWAAWETETYPLRTDASINELIDAKVPSDEHIIELVEQNAPEGITEEEVNDLISAKVAGVLTVNFSIGGPATPASADKTYAEIKEALNSGNTVEGRYNGKSFVYAGTNRSGDISFKQPVYMNDLASVDPQNYGYLITIKSDNNVTFETIAPWGAAQELVDGIPQADWNQSNSEAKDYVKNRTHFDTRGGLNNSGNYAFSASGDSSYPYVATVVSHHSEFYEALYVKTQFSSEAFPITVVDSPSKIVSGTDTCYGQGPITMGLVRENFGGAYLIKAYATMDCSSFEIGIADGVLKQLDEKYIPDTIARKEDIPSVPASPVLWVNATLNGESVTADCDFNYLMANYFTDKVIMCKLSDAYNRWLLVCDYYNSDDAIFAFNPICIGALDGAFPGIGCSPVGWTYSEVYPVG